MTDQIHIEQLELYAHIGVTEGERAAAQRLILTATVWPKRQFGALADDIANTVDYCEMCAVARKFTDERSGCLLETLADGLASHLLKQFPLTKIQLELRKFALPDVQYVSVTVTRTHSGSD
ncbi:MAG: dihydroneopterin aldolase [Chthoniobacterales bacterium]